MSEQELRAVEEDLQKEAAEDAELKSKYGQRWSRPASVALNSQITEKIAGLTMIWILRPWRLSNPSCILMHHGCFFFLLWATSYTTSRSVHTIWGIRKEDHVITELTKAHLTACLPATQAIALSGPEDADICQNKRY